MILCPFCFKTPIYDIPSDGWVCAHCNKHKYSFCWKEDTFYVAIDFSNIEILIIVNEASPYKEATSEIILYKDKKETDRFFINAFDICDSINVINKIYNLKCML